eukprot:TRINITY_DN49986_c0_g1_i1.p1 TRINITY_DN49986_c0_g1~~TRINITY_DN49986_c0_g1_i1.p1  ORF type:complete len:376 (-),score=82.30 TRINITY_DN49986_c0_g1_i1:305-1432(-)
MPSSPAMALLAYQESVCPHPFDMRFLAKQPKLWLALIVSIPCGMLGGALKYYQVNYNPEFLTTVLKDNAAYNTLVFMLGFIGAFRVEAAYNKFWNGCDHAYAVVGDLFDGSADLIAFNKGAQAAAEEVEQFQQTLIRLVSLLSSLIFAELEAGSDKRLDEMATLPLAYEFELIDIEGIDPGSIDTLIEAENKVEVVFQWIMFLCLEGMEKKCFGAPPPYMQRALGNIGSAITHFHAAQVISEVPFPFPYMMALQLMMVTHFCTTPIVFAGWTGNSAVAAVCSFMATFSIWFFVGLAMELDMPFSFTRNSLDMRYLQKLLNNRLMALVHFFTPGAPKMKQGAGTFEIQLGMLEDSERVLSLNENMRRRTTSGRQPS